MTPNATLNATVGATVIVFGETLFENVAEYEVRCETEQSRACRMAAIVVLYAFVTLCCFNAGIRLMKEIDAITIMSATTVIISSKLKPLARCRRSLALLVGLLIPICWHPAKTELCSPRSQVILKESPSEIHG